MSPEVSAPDETRLERVAAQVRLLFDQLDEDTAAFRSSTGLSCPSGCGGCCENPLIEATVVELLPAAFELARRHDAEAFFERPEVQQGTGRCAFFESSGPGKGRCSIYASRAGVCRLFGFGAVHTRRGRELAVCRVHRATDPTTVERATAHVAEGGRTGDFSVLSPILSGIDASLGTHPMPINAALREALSRVLFERDMREAAAFTADVVEADDLSLCA